MAQELRRTFTEDADLYQRARPGYPPELFTDLAELTGIGPDTGSRIGPETGSRGGPRAGSRVRPETGSPGGRRGRVLEIGPGTGQATLELARLAAEVTAIELGRELAAVLRRRLAGLDGRVRVEVGAFEEWPLPPEPFDVVASFTAWHWVDPGVRSAKAAAALSAGGALATVTTSHVRGGSVDFFDAAQECYLRWDPATEPGIQLLDADLIPPATDEADTSPDFHPAIRRRYVQELTYSTAAYLDVLNTYSGHRALPADRRAGLLADLGNLIDHQHGGSITKAYLYELRVAVRK
jgi:SAM-dependent methyltransferase